MTQPVAATAMVTGAAGGLGRAIVAQLVQAGHRVVLVDRDAASLESLAGEIGSNAFALQLDVTDSANVDRLVEQLPESFRPIDILVNNAGHDIGGRTRFDEGSPDDWADIIQTNLIGLMRVTRALLPDMVRRNSGHILNVSSINAVRIIPEMAAYSTSKAGVHMFTETLRGELADTAIRVTELQPGLTRTNIIVTRYRGDRQKEKDYFDQFKMALDPLDVARAVMFAISQPPHVQIAQIMILPVNRF